MRWSIRLFAQSEGVKYLQNFYISDRNDPGRELQSPHAITHRFGVAMPRASKGELPGRAWRSSRSRKLAGRDRLHRSRCCWTAGAQAESAIEGGRAGAAVGGTESDPRPNLRPSSGVNFEFWRLDRNHKKIGPAAGRATSRFLRLFARGKGCRTLRKQCQQRQG